MDLRITNENIEQCYNKLVDFFSNFVEGKVTYGERLTNKAERRQIAEKSLTSLDSKWFNYKPSFFRRSINLKEHSNKIQSYTKAYMKKATDKKEIWLIGAMEQDIMKPNREEVKNWLDALNSIRRDLNKYIGNLNFEPLNCKDISNNQIFNDTVREIRKQQ